MRKLSFSNENQVTLLKSPDSECVTGDDIKPENLHTTRTYDDNYYSSVKSLQDYQC